MYLTKEMEEEGNPLSAACGCCSSKPNSRPMESFTFQTVRSPGMGSPYRVRALLCERSYALGLGCSTLQG